MDKNVFKTSNKIFICGLERALKLYLLLWKYPISNNGDGWKKHMKPEKSTIHYLSEVTCGNMTNLGYKLTSAVAQWSKKTEPG